MHYLYTITNKLNNKVYIGQSNNPKRRWKTHQSLAIKNPIQYIHQMIAKYGVDNFQFDIIAQCKEQENANELEKEMIIQFNSLVPNGYNMERGGNNSSPLPETIEKIKNFYKEHPEVVEEISQRNKELWQNEEYRSNLISKRLEMWADPDFKVKMVSTFKRGKEHHKYNDHRPFFDPTGLTPWNKGKSMPMTENMRKEYDRRIGTTIYTKEEIEDIRQMRRDGYTIKNMSEKYQTSSTQILKFCSDIPVPKRKMSDEMKNRISKTKKLKNMVDK